MNNYVQDGKQITEIAPSGGVLSGVAYKIGSLVTVAAATAAEGEEYAALPCGVFKLEVTAAETPTVNAKAYFKSNNTISTTATSNTLVGVFRSAKDADGNAEVFFTGQVV